MSKKKYFHGVNKLLPKAKFKDCSDYAALQASWEDERPIPSDADINTAYDDWEMTDCQMKICMKARMKIEGMFMDDCEMGMTAWEVLILTLCHARDKDYYPMNRSDSQTILDAGKDDIPTTGLPRLMTDIYAIINHKNKLLKNLDAVTILTLDVEAGTMDTVNGGWPV